MPGEALCSFIKPFEHAVGRLTALSGQKKVTSGNPVFDVSTLYLGLGRKTRLSESSNRGD